MRFDVVSEKLNEQKEVAQLFVLLMLGDDGMTGEKFALFELI